jgi:hypothetical protein
MAKNKSAPKVWQSNDRRARISAKESLERLQEFAKQKEEFVAAIRTGKGRGLSA